MTMHCKFNPFESAFFYKYNSGHSIIIYLWISVNVTLT